MKRAIACLAFALCGGIHAAPPAAVEFKGVPMGATRAELLATIPAFKCTGQTCFLMSPTEPFGPAATKSWLANLREDHVVSIFVSLDQQLFDSVVTALIEKYGKPKSDVRGEVKNRMGAGFEQREVLWILPTGSIQGRRRSNDINTAGVMMMAPGEEDRQAQERADKAKAAASKL